MKNLSLALVLVLSFLAVFYCTQSAYSQAETETKAPREKVPFYFLNFNTI